MVPGDIVKFDRLAFVLGGGVIVIDLDGELIAMGVLLASVTFMFVKLMVVVPSFLFEM